MLWAGGGNAVRERWAAGRPVCSVVVPVDAGAPQELVGCGEPSWEVEIAIVDPASRQRCTPGHIGEIWLRGPNIAQGYWQNPAATEAGFKARIDDGSPWITCAPATWVLWAPTTASCTCVAGSRT
ncbi:AMP-binding protein [Pseudomonas qingdaonensis]|nr:AMP-binding protein [Pseudomonas qingdaonensis]